MAINKLKITTLRNLKFKNNDKYVQFLCCFRRFAAILDFSSFGKMEQKGRKNSDKCQAQLPTLKVLRSENGK